MRWQATRIMVQPGVDSDADQLDEKLSEHWEPFAVTWDGYSFVYHLRQRTDDK